MNPKLLNNLRNILGIASVRQQLDEYFENKNIDEKSMIYPPSIQDINSINEIANKVEVIPFMEELDPTSGNIKVGWNLFVLGTNRKFLGYSVHDSFNDIKESEIKSMDNVLSYATGEEIKNFIVETLQKYNEDQVFIGNMEYDPPQTNVAKMPIANNFYEQNKSVGKHV